MSQIERTIKALEAAEPGFFVKNLDSSREVEVACMTGGRYLCKDPDGEPVKQTDSPCIACMFLIHMPSPADLRQ